jgi:hypothetical protein
MTQESESALARQAEQISAMKQEIDALQVQSKHFIKPWYREGASLVSALALLFSFGTTGVSYVQTKEAEVQRSRAELRELILRLGKSPRELFEFNQRYRSDAAAISSFSSLINQENLILAKQASELIRRIPDRVSAVEHIAVGNSLLQSNLPHLAQQHFTVAAEKAQDYNEIVGAYRSIGFVDFQLGNIESGRANYGLAKTVLRSGRIEPLSETFMNWSDAITEIRWAQAETAAGFCQEFEERLAAAEGHASRLPPAWSTPVAAEILQVREQGCPPMAYVPPVPAEGGLGNAGTAAQ